MNIIIVGTGNVATQMGMQLKSNGLEISLVIGRNIKTAKVLANLLDCPYKTDFKNIDNKEYVYLLAVNDESIEEVSKKINQRDAVMIHTSGSMGIDLLSAENKGVIWPLYSIRKDVEINWSQVPLVVESSNQMTKKIVSKIAKALSNKKYELDSTQRAHAHLLAVFINNFSQHLFYLIGQHQEKMNINPEMYEGIMQDTIDKLTSTDLKNGLTGPARRNDKVTMQKHKDLLNELPTMKALYQNFSDSIIKTYYGEEL